MKTYQRALWGVHGLGASRRDQPGSKINTLLRFLRKAAQLILSPRQLTVVVGAVPGQPTTFYIFSARPASQGERGEFEQQKGDSSP